MRSLPAPPRSSLEAGTVLGLVNVGLWMMLALRAGVGEEDVTWSLVALAATALLALGIALAGREMAIPSRAVAVATVGLVGFLGVNFLSLLWADVPADALSAAEQSALATASFAMLALWPRGSSRITLVLGAWTFAVALTALGVAGWLALGGEPARLFDLDGRLDAPIGYPNAAAALWTMAALPCLVLAVRRRAAPALRVAALGSAALLLQVAVLSQSRGWVIALPFVFLVALVAARQRLRLLVGAALVALGVGSTLHWTLRPLAALAEQRADADSVVRAAALAVLASSLAVAIAGWLWTLADRRVQVSMRARRSIGIVLLAVAVLCAAVGLGALATHHSQVSDWASEQWAELKQADYPKAGEGSRFGGGLGSHRSEEWRIAWDEFVAHPVLGTGADNYHAAWMLHRTDGTKAVRYPHSLPLRMLSELGIVGSALFLLFIGGATIAVVRFRPADDWDARLAAAIPAVYWLAHGAIDWFWEIPALTAPALGLLGLAIAARAPERAPGRLGARVRLVALVATCLVAIVTTISWLSFSYEQAGVASWREHPRAAYADLGRASSLNPLAARPLLVRGSIALRRGDLNRAEADFREAFEREKNSWYALFELGLIASERGNAAVARSAIERAEALNPRDPVIALALRELRSGRTLDASSLNRRFPDPSNGGR